MVYISSSICKYACIWTIHTWTDTEVYVCMHIHMIYMYLLLIRINILLFVCACDVHVLSVCAFIPKVSSMELIVKVLRLIQSQPGA